MQNVSNKVDNVKTQYVDVCTPFKCLTKTRVTCFQKRLF